MSNEDRGVLVDLSQFVDKLMEEKDLGEIDEGVRLQMRKDLLERVEDRVNAMVIERIPVEKMEEFDELLNKGTMEEVVKFCAENISGLDQLVAAELIAFRERYLELN